MEGDSRYKKHEIRILEESKIAPENDILPIGASPGVSPSD